VVALIGAGALVQWLARCRHPNPHYLRPIVQYGRGGAVVVQPASYICYECGKTWPAVSRDPAWSATPVVQKFVGYDEAKVVRAATRASIEEEQRRLLAVNRAAAPSMPKVKGPRRKRSSNVVDLHSRRPA
jgi:hypothetical protein